MPVFLYGDEFPGVTSYDFEESWREAAKRHELVMQHCPKCDNWQHTPRPFCNNCRTPWKEMELAKVSDRGKITGYVHQFRALLAPWQDKVPFTVVFVEIPQTFNKPIGRNMMMLGNLVNFKPNAENPAEPRLFGREVRAVFEDGGNTTIVQWELV